jgi:molybdopterin-guanine dinucleotide biosynthesis protein A
MPMIRQRANTNLISGFVLAGGRSQRMGQDKALLDWNGQPLVTHMIQLLSTICDPIRIVGRQELPDPFPGCGPLGGILTALRSSETDTLIVTAVDLPFLTPDFLRNLQSHLKVSKHRVLACRIGSHFPLCLGLHRELLADVERRLRLSKLSVHGFIEDSDPEILSSPHPAIFQNINTYADYQQALRDYSRRGSGN